MRVDDAHAIVSRDLESRFLYNGKPDLGRFSDLFRYRMVAMRDLVWIDLDVLLLSDSTPLRKHEIFPLDESGVNGAVFYTDDAALLKCLTDEAVRRIGKNLKWGETGPLLLTRLLGDGKNRSRLSPRGMFCPISHGDIHKLLLPEFRDECAETCTNAITLHLINNILVRMGYWKNVAPPKGSFLHERIAACDALGYFAATYPDDVMRRLIENFNFRRNGKALGIGSIVKEAIPSIGRTYRNYYPKPI
ncbi:hypothetical protein AA13595_2653 [Gluconacetobacter johannae DSM 13595]|uniref:hypothetical protein n=1 Tax=Gluconacetobacter johannae TaxID=112140 RepID=UPI002156A364|nr:hypothetical protein [Gluconacetobacter johannae]GBQ89476.1 hypothetical protein AA13595_2653 [Gluconacetobacter johannae DSM 13595]